MVLDSHNKNKVRVVASHINKKLGQGTLFQPQQQLDEGSIEAIGTWVIQTMPVMCDVHVPPYCYTTVSSSSDATTGMSGY
jgi:hypothetical protein